MRASCLILALAFAVAASRADQEPIAQAEDGLAFPDDGSLQGMPEDARGKVAAQESEIDGFEAAVEPKADHKVSK